MRAAPRLFEEQKTKLTDLRDVLGEVWGIRALTAFNFETSIARNGTQGQKRVVGRWISRPGIESSMNKRKISHLQLY